MYLNRLVKADALVRLRLSGETKDLLATRLVRIDDTYKPSEEFIEATKAFNSKSVIFESKWNESFILLRAYMVPFVVLMGAVFYSFSMIKNKIAAGAEYNEKDYKSLTIRQLRMKESQAEQAKKFDSVLNALQEKLKDDYQEQLHEFQDFVMEMDKKENF